MTSACRIPAARVGFVLLVFLILFLPPFQAAVAQLHNLKHYRISEGLPQTQVLALHQDARGYIWVGTYGGLGRFNGREFRVFSTAEGLASNSVTAIADTADGRLWVGTVSGLCYLERRADRAACLEEGPLAGADVQVLLARGDALWVGTADGLYRIADDTAMRFGTEAGLPDADILALAAGADGMLRVGTRAGLARQTRSGFRSLSLPAAAGRQVTALLEHNGLLWVGTDRGLYVETQAGFAAPEGLPQDWPQEDINGLALGRDGFVWAATNNGVLRATEQGFERLTTYHGLMSDITFSILVDREGLVWLGNDDGLSKYTPGPFTGYREKHGLLHYFVRTLNQDAAGRLWLGTREGAQIVPRQNGDWQFRDSVTITREDGLVDERIYSIAFPEPGAALLATGDGVALWREGAGIVKRYTTRDGLPVNASQALYIDSRGRTWIGTNLGVVVLEDGRIRPAPDPRLAGAYVFRIREDRKGRLWFATNDLGLFRLDTRGNVQRYYGQEDFTEATLWDIAPDGEGGIWAGSNGDGLFHITDAGSIVRYTTEDGLVDNFIWQVLVDREGRIWAYTNRGISRLSDGEFRNYGMEDGLLHLEGGATGALQTRDGQLWFASADGLMRYNPAREFTNGIPPRVVIEQAVSNGREITPGTELPYESGSVDFNYAALSFYNRSDLVYRYRLLGAEREWSEPMEYRPITFANLGAGSYTFEVEARNPDGVWSREPARFDFRVLSPYWGTAWFWLLVVLFAALLIWGLFRMRIRQMEMRRRELENLVQERTRELEVANEKLQAVSITDPLTGLRNRRFLSNQIGTDVAQARRAYRGGSEFPNRDILFMMIDLDHFKEINDTYGHSAGDRVLREYAALIAGQIRESDYVVRWGGEEFLVIARHTEASRCHVIAERIMQKSRKMQFVVDDAGHTVQCTCSVGISHFPLVSHAPEGLEWEQIVDIADCAVYRAKSLGRNGWTAILGTGSTVLDDPRVFMRRLAEDLEGLVREGQIRLWGSFEDPLKEEDTGPAGPG